MSLYLSAIKRNSFVFSALICVFFLALFKIHTLDLWFHLRAAEWILKNGSVPKLDPFTLLSEGRKWIYHEWLAGIFFYTVWKIGGASLLVIIKSIWIAIFHFIAYLTAKARRSLPEITVFFIVLGCVGARFRLSEAPHIMFFMAIMAFLYFLDRARREDKKYLYWLIPVQLFWANSHDSFILGPLLMAIAFGGAIIEKTFLKKIGWQKTEEIVFPDLKTWGSVFLLVCLSTLVNPHTYDLWLFLFHVKGLESARVFIGEWQSSKSGDLLSVPAFYFILFILMVWRFIRQKTLPIYDIAILLIFIILSFQAIRFHAVYSLVASIVLASWISAAAVELSFYTKYRKYIKIAALLFVFIITPVVILKNGNLKFGLGVDKRLYPSGAVNFIQSLNSKGNVAALYNWGSYFIGKLPENRKVLVDGRIDIYDQQKVYNLLANKWTIKEWKNYIDKNDINIAAFYRRDIELTHIDSILRADKWELVFWDDMSEVYMRSIDETANEREKYRFQHLGPPIWLKKNLPGNIESCIELKRVAASSDMNFNALKLTARCLATQGAKHILEAEKYARLAYIKAPKSAGSANDLAIILEKQSKFDEAEKFYKEAIEHDESYAEAPYNLANLLWDKKNKEEAGKYYIMFIKYARPQWKAQIDLARKRALKR
ncbi:MAG: tetratricopeptide repeat protein [Spirochaetia bacterium]|nr:tetratricopeptide repeat protein [Spirochaetia bacterium]